MKSIYKHIIYFILSLLWAGMLSSIPFRSAAQIVSTHVMLLPSPVIDSVEYHCSGGLPIQVYVTNQISPCVYSIESTVPAIAPVPDNSTGTFYVVGITDAVFRVHNGSCYTDMAVHFDCDGPLPVILKDFSARLYESNKALLAWDVSAESGILRYELEESSDGRSFRYLATVAASGGSGDKHYEYIDSRLDQGYNFYRLRIVDQDGSVQYSAVRFVIYSRDGAMVWYPNPANRYLYMEFYNERGAAEMDIQVYNSVSGTQWVNRKYKLQPGLNKLAIEVNMLSDGSYYLIYGFDGNGHRDGTIRFQKLTQ